MSRCASLPFVLVSILVSLNSCSEDTTDDARGAPGGTGGKQEGAGGSAATTGGQSGAPDAPGGMGGTGSMAAAGSGGTSTAAKGCEGKSYLICEDFEADELDSIPEGWTKHGGPVGIADDAAMSGQQSLKLGAIDVWERRIYRDASVLGSSHWGRLFYRVKHPVPDAFVHSTLVALVGVGPNIGAAEYRVVDTVKRAHDFEVVEQRNKHQFLYNVQIQGGPEFGEGTHYLWTFEEEWHCAEWHLDSSNQSYALYLDRIEVLSFERGAGNYADAEIPDSFSELRVGWINYQNAPPGFTAWIDDIALDDERIGCDL